MSTATNVKKTDIHDWTSIDHADDCAKAKAAYEIEKTKAENEAKKTGKPAKVRPFICISAVGCCPDDIVVNAGVAPVIVGAQAFVANDSPRIDVGERRQGAYYVSLMNKPGMVGLQRVKNVPLKRLADLEKMRKQRNGEMPADWIVEARERAAKGGGPSPLDPRAELSPLQKAALGVAPD